MRISVLDVGGAAFSLNSSKYAVPKLDVAIMVLPEASIASPFIGIHSLTHARALRTILVEISDDMDELTPHGLPSIDTSRFNVSQLARRRVDAIIGALNGQDHCRTIDGWSEFWSGTRQNMFMMDGRVPKIDTLHSTIRFDIYEKLQPIATDSNRTQFAEQDQSNGVEIQTEAVSTSNWSDENIALIENSITYHIALLRQNMFDKRQAMSLSSQKNCHGKT